MIVHTRKDQMEENEKELLELIRTCPDPQKAITIAAEVIVQFLTQPQSSIGQGPAGPLEPS